MKLKYQRGHADYRVLEYGLCVVIGIVALFLGTGAYLLTDLLTARLL